MLFVVWAAGDAGQPQRHPCQLCEGFGSGRPVSEFRGVDGGVVLKSGPMPLHLFFETCLVPHFLQLPYVFGNYLFSFNAMLMLHLPLRKSASHLLRQAKPAATGTYGKCTIDSYRYE